MSPADFFEPRAQSLADDYPVAFISQIGYLAMNGERVLGANGAGTQAIQLRD